MAMLDWLVQTDGFAPHGYCLLWNPALVWLHLITDGAIALAYLAIPAALGVIGRRRPDLNPHGVLYWFAAFIVLCAATHLVSIVTVWWPLYGLSGAVKAVCALASVVTAGLVWKVLRYVLATPSHAALAAVNDELRHLNERLAQGVADRTQALSSANRRLVAAVYEAREAERIKADFMARMSHELRTPLNAIIGFCEMMLAGIAGPLQERQRDYCASIHTASIQLLDQIDDVLDLDRLGRDGERPVQVAQDLATVCVDAVQRLHPAARAAGVTVVSVVPDDIPVWADPSALLTILTHLISNAVKYSPRGTTVRIQGEAADGGVRVRVVDRGYGVDPAKQARVFEAFYRAHERELPTVGGSGLGLTLVKMLVEAHGGGILFDSRQNEGTVVTVWLPAENGEPGKPEGDVPDAS